VISWIEAMTKIEAAADWIRWCLDGSPIVGWGSTIRGYTWQSANAYLFFTGLVRMKKLVLATVCLVALNVGDLPLSFHPSTIRASAVDTPIGAV
jgi:hypothetical protein